ncbi:MAG TPA: hypothetical protein EYH45_03160 [Candidatus Caldiarchaeum subterraneum]|uniref:Uncharacterized protein n=1 Tax=Caldiarchaeum subterraneum TaxID=311458 RepID=A0A832ZV83_CALS0|nr:hypothetical protein [Candidatus Caldarchaeum subterraneum]
MSWLVKPRRREGRDVDYVVYGVRCVVRVQDGYVYVEAAAKTKDDVEMLRRIVSRCLAKLSKGLRGYEDE